jgi:predicted polyphosphate/ATP-dependent NAD kinase
MQSKKVGLIINPVAGLGGRVGLKGSDGEMVQRLARSLGAVPVAENRTLEALRGMHEAKEYADFITYPGEMGAAALQTAGFHHRIIGSIQPGQTTALDTHQAALDMQAAGVDLLLFAGGDGTARDVCTVIGTDIPVLGIPAGVKILSGAYAIHPPAAGQLSCAYLQDELPGTREVEVLDLNEDDYRHGLVSPQLYGYLRVPYRKDLVQARKAPSQLSEGALLQGIAQDILDQMVDDAIYIIGPGTTTRPILERLGLPKTLIGVDVLYRRQLIAADANEEQLLSLLEHYPGRIIVTPIGGQGYILGRGNQQLSPSVIRKVGVRQVLVVSTVNKLLTLEQRPLLVDSGDPALDQELRGYTRVFTGYHEQVVYPVG